MTPVDYEPPGFVSSEKDSFDFEEEPVNIKVGDVTTVRSKKNLILNHKPIFVNEIQQNVLSRLCLLQHCQIFLRNFKLL